METVGSHHGNADSVGSSPRSRNTDSWEDPPLQSGTRTDAEKLRLMCSYGGHIVPRPHNKSLCYLGGDTRIIVVDRHSNPHTSASFSSPTKHDFASSIGSLLDDSKSETWFVDALNDAGIGPSGLSVNSNSVSSLLRLVYTGLVTGTDTEPARSNKSVTQDMHSVPDSPLLGTTSSFGSASSVSSLLNLPPLWVRVNGHNRLEDQFSQMKMDDGFKDGRVRRMLWLLKQTKMSKAYPTSSHW